jgi:hypothetical protein
MFLRGGPDFDATRSAPSIFEWEVGLFVVTRSIGSDFSLAPRECGHCKLRQAKTDGTDGTVVCCQDRNRVRLLTQSDQSSILLVEGFHGVRRLVATFLGVFAAGRRRQSSPESHLATSPGRSKSGDKSPHSKRSLGLSPVVRVCVRSPQGGSETGDESSVRRGLEPVHGRENP